MSKEQKPPSTKLKKTVIGNDPFLSSNKPRVKTTPILKSSIAQTEEFKRPNHPDFWDSSECKKNKFTGVRRNEHVLEWEFWILGNLERKVHFLEVQKDPLILTKTHMDLFALTPHPDLFKRS